MQVLQKDKNKSNNILFRDKLSLSSSRRRGGRRGGKRVKIWTTSKYFLTACGPLLHLLCGIWYWFPSLNRQLWMKHCCTLTYSLVGMCSGLWTVVWFFATRWLQLCKPPATRLSHSGPCLSRSNNCCSSSFPFWLCQESMKLQIEMGGWRTWRGISSRDISWNICSVQLGKGWRGEGWEKKS